MKDEIVWCNGINGGVWTWGVEAKWARDIRDPVPEIIAELR